MLAMVLADRAGVFGTKDKPRRSGGWMDAETRKRISPSDIETYHGKVFKVTHVADGDTLDVNIPDRVRRKHTTRIRLQGVDTPETVKPNAPVEYFGPEASRFTRQFCLDKSVRLELDRNRHTRDKYGRLLAYVVRPAGQRPQACLNAELIRGGYGYSHPQYPHPRREEFLKLQRQARENRVGLWVRAKQEDPPY